MSSNLGFVVKLGSWMTGFNLSEELEDIQLHTPKSVPETPGANGKRTSKDVPNGSKLGRGQNNVKLERATIHVPFHWPIFTIIISIVQWSVFQFTNDPENEFTGDSNKRHEIWRIFTSIFIHDGELHLWGNLCQQLFAGCCLELVYGWKPVLILYFACAFSADLVESLMKTNFISCGASGAGAGLISANFAAIVLNWNTVRKAKTRAFIFGYTLIEIISKPFWYPYFVKKFRPIFVSDYGESLLSFLEDVSDSAHTGGSIGGLMFGFFLLTSFEPKQWQIRISNISRYFATVVVGLIVSNIVLDLLVYWTP